MSKLKTKICGITNLADARYVSGALVDYIGFILYEKSKRAITPAKVGAMTNWIDGPEKVGVFVNQSLDDVNMIARQSGLDIVQLHGDESPEYCSLVEKPVIKVFHIDQSTTAASLNKQIKRYRPLIDYVLFDTGSETQWGGTGQTFDWDILEELEFELPFFLSGGLNTENVGQAYQAIAPYAVDVCSGLEAKPGKKDFDRVNAFMDKCRAING